MPNEKSKEQQLDDFLAGESSVLSSTDTPSGASDTGIHPLRITLKPSIVASDEPTTGKHHSLRTCACEGCQQKRVALANKWGIISSEENSIEELPEIDNELMGKLLTVPHVYKQTVNAIKYPEIAELWKVSEATEQSLGKFGNAVLTKYLKKANFPYKTELVLGLFWSSDIGIRMLNESKIRALLDADKKLKELKK